MTEVNETTSVSHVTRLAEEIDAGGKAAARVADPRVFPGVMALLMLVVVGMLLMWQRQDMREEREGFLTALRENTTAVRELLAAVANHEREAMMREERGR